MTASHCAPAPTRACSSRTAGWALVAVLVGVLSAGCASFVPQAGPGPEPKGNYVDLTMPVIALGDTQEHESTGHPLHDNDSAVDAYVEVAQRPPEQPLFGRRILEWVLRNHAGTPVIHLGDMLDLSCRAEAERIDHVFGSLLGDGAILPGNHDGLMFGIYGYHIRDAVLDRDARRWNAACRRGAAPDETKHKTASEALSKRDFIGLVIDGYRRRPHAAPGLPGLSAQGDQRVGWRHPDPAAFLSAIEAQVLDGVAYTNSFLVQRLRLPRAPGAPKNVYVIALDTNQSGALVGTWDTIMGRSPGSMGHVHVDQVAAVSPWISEAVRNGDIVVFAGHHNWQSLGLPTRLMLRNLMRTLPHPLVYVSAHTHRGFWAVHRALDRRPLLELNVSSLSDWPIAYRRLSFAWDETAGRLLVRGELLPSPGRPVTNDADLMAAWQQQACARIGPEPDAFLRFDREVVRRQKDSRGSLMEWLIVALAPVCESCEQPLYRHAQAYQDALLDTILQLAGHLGQHAKELHEVKLPDWCDGADFHSCARRLQSEQPEGVRAHAALFRRKAQLVDLLSNGLDELRAPQAAAYMTCRAVQAAQVDFELTDESRNNHRSEGKRRQEHFFLIEASVGND